MIEGGLPIKARGLGPHSRSLSRGAIGGEIDGRSREGRFLRQAERSLLEQLGGDPPFAQRALARSAARLMLAAEMLAPSDATTLGGLSGALLEVLRELDLPQPSLKSSKPG